MRCSKIRSLGHRLLRAFERILMLRLLCGITWFCIKSYSYAVVEERKSGRSDTLLGIARHEFRCATRKIILVQSTRASKTPTQRTLATWHLPFEASHVLARKGSRRSSTSNDASLRQLPQLFQCDLDDKRSSKALSIFAHAFAVRSNLRPPSRLKTNSSSSSPGVLAPKQASTPEG